MVNPPTPTTEGLSRITQYDRQGRLLNEYAYRLDAIPKSPGKGKEAENGVSELLAINNHEFLTLERASVQSSDNSYHNYVRIYKINTDQATDIKNQESLKQTKIHPVKKELIADLNKEDIGHIDNIEGITFGKQLPNGHDSIVIVADNNFNKAQKQQFMAFEVIPK
ncbi:esterase-like activity of phytase family protein [Staphylococcus saprophyticus]|uniref:esterase-like activity of phytase family protein n=1 Tax=Staphylococcus saprophyticus TaxID=29385 RepID=UPI002977E0FA|nr:esterase-like activity of phytase family protein [Staphylococcus saprophyticus]